MITAFADAPTQTSTMTVAVLARAESTAAMAPAVPMTAQAAVIVPPPPGIDRFIREPWVAAVAPPKSSRSDELPILVVPVSRRDKLETLRLTMQSLAGHAKHAATVADLLGADFESQRGVSVHVRRTASATLTFSERARLVVADQKQMTEAAAYRLLLRGADGAVVEVRLALAVGLKSAPNQPVGVLQLMATSPVKTNAGYLVIEQLRQSLAKLWAR